MRSSFLSRKAMGYLLFIDFVILTIDINLSFSRSRLIIKTNPEAMDFTYSSSFKLILFLVFTMATSSTRGQEHHDVCAPVLSYVDADPEYRTEPLVVKLHRCVGKTKGSSRNKQCVAATTKQVTYRVYDTGVVRTGVITNHTSCVERCRYDASLCNANQTWDGIDCSCHCNFNTPQQCEQGLRWDSYQCACVCPMRGRPAQCNQHKLFSEEACGCICEIKRERKCRKKGLFLDPDTCYCTINPPYVGAQEALDCKHTGVISKLGLILVCISEAFLFAIAYVMYRRYCYHRDICRFKKSKREGGDGLDPSRLSLQVQNTPNADKRSLHTPTIEISPPAQNGNSYHNNKQKSNNNIKMFAGSASSYDALLKDDDDDDDDGNNEHEKTLEEERDAWRRSNGGMVKVWRKLSATLVVSCSWDSWESLWRVKTMKIW